MTHLKAIGSDGDAPPDQHRRYDGVVGGLAAAPHQREHDDAADHHHDAGY